MGEIQQQIYSSLDLSAKTVKCHQGLNSLCFWTHQLWTWLLQMQKEWVKVYWGVWLPGKMLNFTADIYRKSENLGSTILKSKMATFPWLILTIMYIGLYLYRMMSIVVIYIYLLQKWLHIFDKVYFCKIIGGISPPLGRYAPIKSIITVGPCCFRFILMTVILYLAACNHNRVPITEGLHITNWNNIF